MSEKTKFYINLKKFMAFMMAVVLLVSLFSVPVHAAGKKTIKKSQVAIAYTKTVYSGKAKKPAVTVTIAGKKLRKKTDYTVTYQNNKEPGKAKVIIKGKGNYKGTVTKTYKIIPKATKITSLTSYQNSIKVKWKKQTKGTHGYQLQVSTSKKFKKGRIELAIASPYFNIREITGLVSAKNYYVRVRTFYGHDKNTVYSAWSEIKNIKTKAQPEKANEVSLVTANSEIALHVLKERIKADGKVNSLFSPLSLYEDLAMATNGAKGNTLKELEDYLGGAISDVNTAVENYNSSLPQSLQIANSIWINEAYGSLIPEVKETTEKLYNARIETVPYNDETVEQINNWVNENTKEMIPSLLDKLEADEVMHLINAVAFEADWKTPYESEDITDAKFKNADGESQDCIMLHSTEKEYIDLMDAAGNTIANGFIRSYADDRTAFVGILPEYGKTPEDVLAVLDGEKFAEMIGNRREYVNGTLYAGIPEFKFDDSLDLNSCLESAGVKQIFTGKADLSGMMNDCSGLYINSVTQKTHIEVDRNGTKAAAVTDIGVKASAALPVTQDLYIILNRPFIYAIIDLESGLPLFMGVEYKL